MNATEIALDGANAMIERLQADLDANQKRQQNTHRERLDRFVAAALSGDVPSQSQETDLPEFAKHICDIAEAVLAELERREKEP